LGLFVGPRRCALDERKDSTPSRKVARQAEREAAALAVSEDLAAAQGDLALRVLQVQVSKRLRVTPVAAELDVDAPIVDHDPSQALHHAQPEAEEPQARSRGKKPGQCARPARENGVQDEHPGRDGKSDLYAEVKARVRKRVLLLGRGTRLIHSQASTRYSL
jgi:hypothetical protein